jgi:uncharacterized protein (DUF433 family)
LRRQLLGYTRAGETCAEEKLKSWLADECRASGSVIWFDLYPRNNGKTSLPRLDCGAPRSGVACHGAGMWQNPLMNPNPTTTWKYLPPTPKSAYKQLFIKGRRIRARDLYGMYMSAEEPMAPADSAADFDLPLESVEEAVAYCQTDPPEIKEDFEREERIMEATGMNDPDYKYGGKYRVLSAQERARLGL